MPVAKIPVPTDNYDAPHSTVAAITSLRAMAAAVDAAMDSLLVSVDRQSARVDALNERAVAYRKQVAELCADGDRDKEEQYVIGRAQPVPPLRLELPATYDRAIGKVVDNNDEGQQQQQEQQQREATAVAAARRAAHEAVRAVLRSDRERDDGGAVPSDAWLDRPTAFDEAAECAAAVESMAVPSLRSQVLQVADEVAYYEEIAAAAADAAALSGSALGSSTAKSSSEDYDYDDMASVRTGMTGLTLSSRITTGVDGGRSIAGGGVSGAAERRRQRQQAQLERRRRQKRREQAAGRGSTVGEAAAAVEDIFDRASAVRQQVLSGSKPYLADVLHDAYGAESGSKLRTADELVVFNSTS
jgi:hypothetical protein